MLLVFSLIFRFFPYGRLRVKYPVSYRILYCRWDRNLCAVCITRRIFLRIDWWKNFENWSTFAKVINKHQVAYFFETPCSCYLKRIGLSNVVMRTLPRWWERYRGDENATAVVITLPRWWECYRGGENATVVMRMLPRWWERYRGDENATAVVRTLPRQFTECDIVTRYVTLSNCVTSLTNNLYRSEVIDCWLCTND